MNVKKRVLSKSRVMSGLQCEKLLHMSIYKTELGRKPTATEQARFDAGNEVGLEAQKRFPGGFEVKAPYYDYQMAIDLTTDAIDKGVKTIYEASFQFDDIFARIDILNFKKEAWDLIEVKSTASVKEQHIYDVAVQAYIFMNTGLPLNKCFLMHLNTKCFYPDLKNLFTLEDITEDVEELIPKIEKEIKKLKKIANSTTEPKVAIGPHCMEPYACPYMDTCWKGFPEKNIFQLPGLGAKAWDLFDQGYKKITELNPNDFNGNIKRAIEVTKTNKRFVDKVEIREEIKDWKFPLYFFDFETISPVIPRYENTKSYGALPFQYSCHVMKSKDSKTLEHFEYLHTDASDPRQAIAKSIVENFDSKGSIVAYNMGFERGVLNSLANHLPKYKKSLMSIADRLVDPLPIFRKHIYDPEFLGQFSIKLVAPAIIGEKLNYSKLDVSDGTQAGTIVNLLMTNKITDKNERQKQTQALLEYCRQDTMAMVELVRWLFKQS